jgi:DNA-binding transcriptional LysR family regulator
MDVKLKTFLTLLEEKNYTKTAKKLFITQPAVTHHIKQLESDYKISLFEDTKKFTLTKKGKILYEYAKKARLEDEQLINSLKREEDKQGYNLGLTDMVASCLMSSRILSLLNGDKRPFNVFCTDYLTIENKILNGEYDFGIIDHSFDSEVFNSISITSSEIVLVCSSDGIYKDKDRITREMLTSATIILSETNTGLNKTTTDVLKEKNIRLRNNMVLETNNADMLVKMVKFYDGIGFAYIDSVRKYIDDGSLHQISLLNFSPVQTFYLIYNKVSYLDDEITNLFTSIKKKLGTTND